MWAHRSIDACELKNKVARRYTWLALLVLLLVSTTPAVTDGHQPATPADSHATPADHAPDGEHADEEHGVLSGLLWPTANFIILAGGLWWFLKDPMSAYLRDRHSSIRKDLVEAAQLKSSATADLAEIDRRLAALPGEIEALRRRGGEEIAAEEHRIAAQAAAERERLLEQTRREIELQVRLAKRELTTHAANLAVQLASDRLKQTLTADDQQRLVDRYLDQVTPRPS
jgi:F-type H+-transporting ATPase subunit b